LSDERTPLEEIKYRQERLERVEDKFATMFHAHANGRHRDAARALIEGLSLFNGYRRDYSEAPRWARDLLEETE
jgi:hypothetical protein